ncbi:sulfurtransferase TusA family protein [Vibrio sp. MA40-2]|uniref:sulfurtransferase TusA family protein n=1 Tax=Vibrio sp. MA40-2 TaxID=3391828 RepID=UPI0039A6CB5D
MKPYILDLREQGCPMALLIVKRACSNLENDKLIVQIRDVSSKDDIVRYLHKQNFSVQVEQTKHHFELVVHKLESSF